MPEQTYTEVASADYADSGGLVTVANTSALVVPANISRSRIVISADNPAWLGYGTDETAAVLNEGIYLPGFFPFVDTDWKGAIYVIEPAGGVHVAWTETSFNVGDDEGEDNADALEFVPSGPSDGHPATDVPAFDQPPEDE